MPDEGGQSSDVVTVFPWAPATRTRLLLIEAYRSDLFTARLFANESLNFMRAFDSRRALTEALSIAALTKYFRCFGSGHRQKLLDTARLPPNRAQSHSQLKAIRDRHFNHPVNQFEVHHVSISVSALGTDKARATQVGSATSALLLGEEETHALIELCDFWQASLETMQATETSILLREAQKLTAEQLNNLPHDFPSPHPDPTKKRK